MNSSHSSTRLGKPWPEIGGFRKCELTHHCVVAGVGVVVVGGGAAGAAAGVAVGVAAAGAVVSAGRPHAASIPINAREAKPDKKMRLNVAFIFTFRPGSLGVCQANNLFGHQAVRSGSRLAELPKSKSSCFIEYEPLCDDFRRHAGIFCSSSIASRLPFSRSIGFEATLDHRSFRRSCCVGLLRPTRSEQQCHRR
jgi:hypothetical protein